MFETDAHAWQLYPHHRWAFNKLELSLRLGYAAGPGGTSVITDGEYIVRPIYNLSGMGVGARRTRLQRGDNRSVLPGEFWCEYFHGPTITVDYEWRVLETGEKLLSPIVAAEGIRTSPEMYRFNAWRRIEHPPMFNLPQWIAELHDVPRFNIEFVHDQIIEIHLRSGNDFPEGSTFIVPIWNDMHETEYHMFLDRGFKIQMDFDDADGHLPCSRVGFFYK